MVAAGVSSGDATPDQGVDDLWSNYLVKASGVSRLVPHNRDLDVWLCWVDWKREEWQGPPCSQFVGLLELDSCPFLHPKQRCVALCENATLTKVAGSIRWE